MPPLRGVILRWWQAGRYTWSDPVDLGIPNGIRTRAAALKEQVHDVWLSVSGSNPRSERSLTLLVALGWLPLLWLTVCPRCVPGWHIRPTHYELQAGRLAESTVRCAKSIRVWIGPPRSGELAARLAARPLCLELRADAARVGAGGRGELWKPATPSEAPPAAQPWVRLIPAEAAPSVSPSIVNASAGPMAPLPPILPCWPQIAAQARNSAVNA